MERKNDQRPNFNNICWEKQDILYISNPRAWRIYYTRDISILENIFVYVIRAIRCDVTSHVHVRLVYLTQVFELDHSRNIPTH